MLLLPQEDICTNTDILARTTAYVSNPHSAPGYGSSTLLADCFLRYCEREKSDNAPGYGSNSLSSHNIGLVKASV